MLQPICFANNNMFTRRKVYWNFFFLPQVSWISQRLDGPPPPPTIFFFCPTAAVIPSSTNSSFHGAATLLVLCSAAASPQCSQSMTQGARASSNKSGTICASSFPASQPKLCTQPSFTVTSLSRACLLGRMKVMWEEVVRDAPCKSIFEELASGWAFPFKQERKIPKSVC